MEQMRDQRTIGKALRSSSMGLVLVGILVVGCAGFGGRWAEGDTDGVDTDAERAAAGDPIAVPDRLWVPRLNEVVAAVLGRMLEEHETASGTVGSSPVDRERTACAAPSE